MNNETKAALLVGRLGSMEDEDAIKYVVQMVRQAVMEERSACAECVRLARTSLPGSPTFDQALGSAEQSIRSRPLS